MTNEGTETPAKRLGRYVRARRKELKLTQVDVQEAGGPSTATLRLIEGGKHTEFRDGTGLGLEFALNWQPGSIDSTLAGNEPSPVESSQSAQRWKVDQNVDLSSTGLVHMLNLLWTSWRQVAQEVSPKVDPDAARQTRRALILTADVVLDLLALSAPIPEAEVLSADVMSFVNELFSGRPLATGGAVEPSPVPDDREETPPPWLPVTEEQIQPASTDDPQGRAGVERLKRIVERVRVEQPQHGDNEGA